MRKKVLLMGFKPTTADLKAYPEFTEEALIKAIEKGVNKVKALDVDLTNHVEFEYHEGDREETENFEKAKGWLKEQAYDIIMIGAGVRTNPEKLFFFEKLINQVHKLQPQASICFNTRAAEDAAEAVQRWL